MPLSVQGTSKFLGPAAYHSRLTGVVNVGCEHSIGSDVSSVDQSSKVSQVLSGAYLIDTTHLVKRPSSTTEHAHEHAQKPSSKTFVHVNLD